MSDIIKACRTLLLELYDRSQRSRIDEHVLLPGEVAHILQVNLYDTISVVDFLEERGYIKCGHPIGSPYSWIKLTTQGLQFMENTQDFNAEFPLDPGEKDAPHQDENPAMRHGGSVQPFTEGASVQPALLQFIHRSAKDVWDAMRQGDDLQLRHFLSELMLSGGLEGTLTGVKALIAMANRQN